MTPTSTGPRCTGRARGSRTSRRAVRVRPGDDGHDAVQPVLPTATRRRGRGRLRPGAAHLALPDRSGGAAQAGYFVDHGGGWTADGKTLPGALDIEYNPYGAACYGLSQSAMQTWLEDFVNTYRSRVGRAPVIYTTAALSAFAHG